MDVRTTIFFPSFPSFECVMCTSKIDTHIDVNVRASSLRKCSDRTHGACGIPAVFVSLKLYRYFYTITQSYCCALFVSLVTGTVTINNSRGRLHSVFAFFFFSFSSCARKRARAKFSSAAQRCVCVRVRVESARRGNKTA